MFTDITIEFWSYNDGDVKDELFIAILIETHILSNRSNKLSAIIYDENGTVYIEQDYGPGYFTMLPKHVQKQIYNFLKDCKLEHNLKKIYNTFDGEYTPIYIN